MKKTLSIILTLAIMLTVLPFGLFTIPTAAATKTEANNMNIACEHIYDNACDAECNICGAVREASHTYYSGYVDIDCNICGYTMTSGYDYYSGYDWYYYDDTLVISGRKDGGTGSGLSAPEDCFGGDLCPCIDCTEKNTFGNI